MNDALFRIKIDDKIKSKILEIRDGKYVVKGVLPYVIRRNLNRGENFVGIVTGKTRCQPKGSKVLMANGEWKNIEEIKIGDEVISPQKDGTNIFSKVVDTHIGKAKTYGVYDLKKNQKLLYSCADNHKIPLYNIRYKGSKKRKSFWSLEKKTPEELSKFEKTKHNRMIFSSFPIDKFKDRKNCSIEPYTLGVFLGDGCFYSKIHRKLDKRVKQERYYNCSCRMISITTTNPEIMEEISKHYQIMNISLKKDTIAKAYRFSINGELSKHLIEYGLEGKDSGNKFIPKEALYSDIDYRRRLLAGLIDTDGYLSKERAYSICTKSKQLAEDIEWLIHSLGGRCSVSKIKKKIKILNFEGEYYNIFFNLGKDITKVPIKIVKKIKNKNLNHKKYPNRTAFEIKEKRIENIYGITIDSNSSMYITDNFMTSFNSGKSFSALRICMEIDPNFSLDNVVFSAKEFMVLLHSGKLKKGSMVIWDEAGVGIATRDWYSILNKSINYVLQTWGHQNIGLILTVPDFSFIDSQTRRLVNMHFKTIRLVRSRNVAVMKVYHLTPMESAEPKKVRPRYTICGKKLDIEYFEVKKPKTRMVNRYLKKKEEFTAKLNDEVLFDIQQFEKSKEIDQVKIVSDEDLINRAWNLLKDEITIKAGKRRISAYIVKKKLGITMSRAMYIQIKLMEKAENEQYPPLESEKIFNEVDEEDASERLSPKKFI